MPSYELAVLGDCPSTVITPLLAEVTQKLAELGLSTPSEVTVFAGSVAGFTPNCAKCCAALCFATSPGDDSHLLTLMTKGVPIVPVVHHAGNFSKEAPQSLRPLNGLALDRNSIPELAYSLLECAGLLPNQRRVFISYRRGVATDAALKLYAALSARAFDAFLDTHKLHPGDYFQEVLWQRLSECDVLLMLDSVDYFASRWTSAEFGRAMVRGLALVRVGWPTVAVHPRAQAAVNLQLSESDFDGAGAQLNDAAVKRICEVVEEARTKSVATRFRNLINTLDDMVTRIGGKIDGISLRRAITIRLPDGRQIAAYPTLGAPTLHTLHDATTDNHTPPVAVIYDDVGLSEKTWRTPMSWLDQHVRHQVRLVPSYRSGWDFADWQNA